MKMKIFNFFIVVLSSLAIPAMVSGQSHFMRGDANHDRMIDVSDTVYTLFYLFVEEKDPPCEDAVDFDDSGGIDVTDAIDLLRYLFIDGEPPEKPFPVFEADPSPDPLTCLPEVPGDVTAGGSILTGDITEDVILTNDKTYRMVNSVYITEGATLTIEPGVTIFGDSATKPYLVVERGAKIFADGTETHPIVFTSDKPVGQRKRADWGGILILGRGPSDVPGGEWVYRGFEGIKNVWAGGGDNPDPEDSSGRLSHVRIEYSGANIQSGIPLSAISFLAVGSRTQLDHIQAKYGNDDGIEFYGGTCSLKYGISVGMADEGYDVQFGWQGYGQYLICLQRRDRGNHGVQDGDSPSAEPRTIPTWSNVTLVGAWASGSRSDLGLLVQNRAGIQLYNAIVQGWRELAIEFGSSYGPVTIDRTVFYGNGDLCDCSSPACPCDTLMDPPLQNVEATEPVLGNLDNLDEPDLRGIASQMPEPFDPTTIDDWFDPVTYVGAVPPEGEGENWTRAPWISWQQE